MIATHVDDTCSPPSMLTISREAFGRVVREHQDAVCAVAFSALRDRGASEEIAQEAFLVAWRKWPGLTEAPKLPAWICGIARNLARNARRQTRPVSVGDEVERVPDEAGTPLDSVLDAESRALVWRALESLPDKYREPLVLFYRSEQSTRQVAAALNVSEDTAKQRLSRGRSQLETRVRGLVEQALRTTGPGTAFTASVVAAVLVAPTTAHAAPAAAASGSMGKAALLGIGIAGAVALGATALASLGAPETSRAVAITTAATADPAPSTNSAAPTPSLPEAPLGRRHRAVERAEPAAASDDSDPWGGADTVSPELRRQLSRRIDIDLSEASVTDVLRMLGDVGQVNIVVRGDIASDVTFDLHATTVLEALDETLQQAAAVWREVPLVRVVDGPGPVGPPVEGPKLTLVLREVDFRQAMGGFASALEIPILVTDGLEAPTVTTRLDDEPGGAALTRIIRASGLRYEVEPAIQVRPEEEVDAEDP